VAVNYLPCPRATVRERQHRKRRAHIERVWLDPNQAGLRDEARPIAANIAKLLELLTAQEATDRPDLITKRYRSREIVTAALFAKKRPPQ
jgi:hypothetical protein